MPCHAAYTGTYENADPPIGLQSADRIGQLGGSMRAINQNADAAAMGFGGDEPGRKQHSGGGS